MHPKNINIKKLSLEQALNAIKPAVSIENRYIFFITLFH